VGHPISLTDVAAGQVVKKGPNTSSRLKLGDRVSVFHVSGCHECDDCRMLRPCSCTLPLDFEKGTGRRAYGWQRDGGHAEYICCDEQSLVKLPDSLSYLSGAMIACGYGTAYSGVMKAKVSGHDKVLIIGLGPVGLSVAQICMKMGASQVHGVEVVPQRKKDAEQYGIKTFDPSEVDRVIGGNTSLRRGYEVVFDCSGSSQARVLGIEATKRWGRMVFIGGYGNVTIDISPLVIQKQLTMLGTWTFSIAEHEELHRKLVEWKLHPDKLISHTFPIDEAETAYRLFDEGKSNKVAIVFD